MADYGTIKVNKVTYKNGSDADTDFNFKTDIVGTSTENTFTNNIIIDNQKELRLGEPDGAGTNYVGFEAPDTIASNVIWKLPNADGSASQFLKTDGSGNLSWASDATTDSTKLPLAGGTLTGNLSFEGATANDYETTLTVVDPTADRTITFPDATGTVALGVIGTDIQAYDADTAKKDTLQAWTKPQVGTPGAITHGSAGAMNIDLSASNNFEITLNAAGTLTFTNFTNAKGQTGLISIKNGGTHAVTYHNHVLFAGGTDAVVTATANAVTLLSYYVYDVTGSSEKVIVTGIADVKDS